MTRRKFRYRYVAPGWVRESAGVLEIVALFAVFAALTILAAGTGGTLR